MNKKNIIFGVGAMLLLLASCSGEKTLEGYNFNGEGFLGKLPMAQALQRRAIIILDDATIADMKAKRCRPYPARSRPYPETAVPSA